MKIQNITKLFFVLMMAVAVLSCKGDDTNFETMVPKSPVPFADPFILLHEGVYYSYGTYAADGIDVYTSDDLKLWKKGEKLALHKDDSWGDRWFWAPEVYYIKEKNKFFMYYSVDEHIAVATSDSPLGPFKQESKVPMMSEKGIDNTLFIDDDGQAYLYFNRFNAGNVIWVAKLNDDLITMDQSTMTECARVSQEWERKMGTVNEGACVMKHNDKYYLTYSANDYQSPYYGVGFATSDSPMGPWTKYENNPILQKPKDLVGTGHSSIFKDKNGKLKIVFHAHYDKTTVSPRFMYTSDVSFTNDNPAVMVVSEDYETARITY